MTDKPVVSFAKALWNTMLRECGIIRRDAMYAVCLLVFPVVVTVFFTTLMDEGQPADMPVGVVDLDNSATSRNIIRRLDAFQNRRESTAVLMRQGRLCREVKFMVSYCCRSLCRLTWWLVVSPRCHFITP